MDWLSWGEGGGTVQNVIKEMKKKKISEEIKIFKRDGMLIKKVGALKQCLVGVLRSPYEL